MTKTTRPRRRRAVTLALGALLALVLGASAAFGWDAPIHRHSNFTTGGWDYYYTGTVVTDSLPCYPEHTDFWRMRRQFCPWCELYV